MSLIFGSDDLVNIDSSVKFILKKGKNIIISSGCEIKNNVTIYPGVALGMNVKVYHGALLRDKVFVGRNSVIGSMCILEPHASVGDNSTLHSRVILTDHTRVGNFVFIGPGTVVTNTKYIMHGRGKPRIQGCTIYNGARVGANCTILPNVHIGKEAVIGAGSVVTKDVPDGEIWYGNPAKKRGKVPKEEYHPELNKNG